MTRTVAFLMITSLAVTLSTAAPIPKNNRTPITALNAANIDQIFELEIRVQTIERGPAAGLLIMRDTRTPGIEIVDEITLKPTRTMLKDQPRIDGFAITADGKRFAWNKGNSKEFTIENTDTKKSVSIKLDNDPSRAAFSPDGKLLAIGEMYWDPNTEGAGDSWVHIYSADGMLIRTLEKGGPGGLKPVFSPDGKLIAINNRNYEPRVFDVATGKLLFKADKRMTQEVAFSPDGKLLACGFVDGMVGIWDIASGKKLHLEPSGCQEIYSVDWNPTGDLLATAGRSGDVILWNPKTMEKLKSIKVGLWVIQSRFSSDGTRLITSSASDHTARNDRKVISWGISSAKEK